MGIKRGLSYSFGRTGGQFALQFASNVVLARLLLPSEIGIFSVAMAVITVLQALRDFGVGRYLVKEPNLTVDKIRTVFGVSLLVSWSLAALLFFGRDSVAGFYAEPQIAGILALLSINFLLLPFGQPAFALMRRELRYGRLAAIALAAGAAGVATSIGLAALGFGPMALAYGTLANSGASVALTLLSRPDHIFLRPSLREWRAVCGFGALASAGTIIVQIGMQAPELLLGRFLGFAAVGLYGRGLGIATIVERFFVSAVTWVIGAELGSRYRSEQSLSELVLKATDYTLVVGWAALIFLALKAEAIIWLLFGETWLPAAPLVPALCLARGLQMIVSQAPSIYEGTGAVGLQLRNEIILQIVSVGLLLIGVQYGLEAVAWLRVPMACVVISVHLSAFRRYADIGFGRILFTIWRSGAVALAFGAALAGLMALEPAETELSPLILLGEGAVMGLVYLTLISVLSHPFGKDLRAIISRESRA
jgi:O-antigen/teichoic acid export membrane protein